MDFGAWEGQCWGEVGDHSMAAWMADFQNHRPGGGESVQSLLDRVADALTTANSMQEDCAWITHAGVIRAARLLVRGQGEVRTAGDWPQEPVPFGSWEVFDLGGEWQRATTRP
ncbi:MAG: Alpha-ribazole-5'-phosphate phosphatase [uncultured Ramlibacter sp.]|uniref:Alpha-ribazole-5'-phosphate phosphatase n=1 Tax=uncultured Ramlibacter sp. TaxID=260755 RepID=A0A6J4PII6_9BURK|nr:MAG: Alpha-ribazole-5'-phosphate phosphatase [uncultured Ramlibacter sp.]